MNYKLIMIFNGFVTVSYFIYLSNISYEKRQRILHQWYQNISILANKTPITSFLPIFLLYEQEFNTDSVDNLPDFYENMAIIFHSAKPIAIRDATLRGRQWLIKNCSFLYLREDQKDFLEILAQSLTKSSNIIIEVNSQQTMEHLLETVIGALLFLPQDVSSVSISGQQINVHSEVYLLVDKKVKMPKDLQVQFTVVLFDQSQQLIRAILTHDYLTATQRDPYSLKLEIHNRIRTLKLQCQNFITQIAENIYEQLCPNQQPPQEQLLSEKLNQINDKLMIKIQNQFTKIKEKEELIRDLQEKYEKNELRINYAPTEIFLSKVNQIRQVLITLSSNPLYGRYSHFEFHSYFQTIKSGLSKGFIQNIPSLFLFSLRHWGGCYRQKDYVIFAVMLLIVWRGGEVKEFVSCLTEEALRTGLIMTFLGKSRRIFHDELQIETAIVDYFHQQLAQDQLDIHLFLPYQHNIFLPLVWPTPAHNHRLNSLDNHEEMSKVLRILSQDEGGRVKEKLLSLNLGIVWANGDEGVESLVKKNRGEDWLVLVHDEDGLLQTQKLIKGWFLGQKSLIFVHNNGLSLKCDKERFFWEAELDNQQTIFHKVLQICKRQRSSESLEKANEQADQSLRISQRTSQTQVQASPDYASTDTPMEANNTQIEPSKDNYLILLSQLNHFMQREYEGKGLKVFEMKENQMVLIRKAFQNSQNPLGMQEKIDYCFRYIERLFIMPFKEIRNHFSALKTSMYKSLQKQTSEQPFFQEAAALLAQTTTLHLTTESNILKTQLGWLINTRKLFNLNNEVIIQKFITKVNSYAAPSYLYTATPTINRSNKKPALLKAKRQSLAKKNVRESYSLGKKGQLNKILEVKCFNSLARLQILKEQEHYDQILQRIYKELDIARKELLCIQSQGISGSTLDLLAHLNQNTPLPSWKLTLAPIADGLTLTNHIQDLLFKRNQLYTYHTKFHLQDFAEIDLKNFKQPAHFISAYCRCEQNHTYVLTTSLTQEEVEKKNYLKVNGLWAWNWRFSSEGILESLSDNKFNLLVGCYLLEKSSLGTYTSGVDLFGSAEEGDAILRVHVASKKTSVSQVNRVYLKLQV